MKPGPAPAAAWLSLATGQAPLDPMGLVAGGVASQSIAAHHPGKGQPKSPSDHPQPLSTSLLSMASTLLEPAPWLRRTSPSRRDAPLKQVGVPHAGFPWPTSLLTLRRRGLIVLIGDGEDTFNLPIE